MRALSHYFVDLDGVRLHYVRAGEGEPVVLLHGWPQTWFMWRDIIPPSSERFAVIAPDLRGLGDSGRPDGGYDKVTVAKDIADLMTRRGHARFRVVAHGWGWPVVFALGARFPERVATMAIVDAPVLGDGGDVVHHGRWHFGFHALPDLPEMMTEGREDRYLRFFDRFGGARPDVVGEDAQADQLLRFFDLAAGGSGAARDAADPSPRRQT